MSEDRAMENLAEALVQYLKDNDRLYVVFFPITKESNYISTNCDITVAIGLMYTLAKTFSIPFDKLAEIMQIIDIKGFVDISDVEVMQ